MSLLFASFIFALRQQVTVEDELSSLLNEIRNLRSEVEELKQILSPKPIRYRREPRVEKNHQSSFIDRNVPPPPLTDQILSEFKSIDTSKIQVPLDTTNTNDSKETKELNEIDYPKDIEPESKLQFLNEDIVSAPDTDTDKIQPHKVGGGLVPPSTPLPTYEETGSKPYFI
ncbi:hypothetical protein TVAG_470750 [Trichomonas vaginalis G3]|uniref:Uncharacterized protein n=1 Tax=Trichomonas vaginalis (strain ATCC PRA-98 / G3) TaxID=412133 RepID=A2EMC0_TRIV3|nr:hypothetical protein TVAGG3_0707180 [Trichomonas vaginalis G3]EAY06232.1 hypothetical protein TVAG_470750 [Trichomonas vaginalis G3]KAI5509638.1 hypothetical protein TVAGG3_0707180 [Trichomonas vaginalis G3]|eukprot:XP_001318455.1 hypothetical protein [Trichomonas vaginalis G3]